MVIVDIMNDFLLLQGRYPESFVLISLLLAEIYAKQIIRPIVIMATLPNLTQLPKVIQDVLDVVGRPQGSYTERFVSISLLFAEI